MQWIDENSEKPPYDTPVLIWIDCENCRADENHSHPCVATEWNFPNSFQRGTYVKGISEDDRYAYKYHQSMLEDHWCPIKPSHWAYIPSPFDNKEGE